ncbi:hypothetical protein [Planctomicrobium piriforme]|uniref:MJ0042 family finger-like domain-containing protein n=1 Tax=Planctomicrobium piriforme TaxID=1576369 RepID=A0A1I3D7A6_9PLAN|nr:hypothetical protein [Planctomicrobium piriforme]SFH82391.1 MJ0042 family finger-like domain-containing protein [Planctomicrobium piriforme]
MLQKYRVFCPHCAASLLVTEDLMGIEATCPGCSQVFMLPTAEELDDNDPVPVPAVTPPLAESAPAVEPPPIPAQSIPAPFLKDAAKDPADSGKAARRKHSPVKIQPRPELKLFSVLLKFIAIVQVCIGFGVLVMTLVMALSTHPGTAAVLTSVGTGLLIGISAIPTFAFAELILVFTAQEEMLRHILNELRSRD